MTIDKPGNPHGGPHETVAKKPPDNLRQWTKEVRKRMRLVEKARVALSKLEPPEQALLFREFGRCACSEIAKLTKNPDVAVGAIVGGIIGAMWRKR